MATGSVSVLPFHRLDWVRLPGGQARQRRQKLGYTNGWANAFGELGLVGTDWAMTNQQALTRALYLALVAPTEEQAEKAVKLSEKIAAKLQPVEVARAKQHASAMAGKNPE